MFAPCVENLPKRSSHARPAHASPCVRWHCLFHKIESWHPIPHAAFAWSRHYPNRRGDSHRKFPSKWECLSMQKKTVQILSIALFALFLLWGGGSLIYYVGVPVHGMVLLGGNEQSITEVCGSASIFCRGFYSFLPMLQHTLTRAAVFLPYFLVSLTAYG